MKINTVIKHCSKKLIVKVLAQFYAKYKLTLVINYVKNTAFKNLLVKLEGVGADGVGVPVCLIKLADGLGESDFGLVIKEHASFALLNCFKRSSATVSNHRTPGGHCFKRHNTEVLFLRKNYRLRTGINLRHFIIRQKTEELYAWPSHFLESLALRPVTNNLERLAHCAEYLDRQVKSLIWHQPANHQKIIINFFRNIIILGFNRRINYSGITIIIFLDSGFDKI